MLDDCGGPVYRIISAGTDRTSVSGGCGALLKSGGVQCDIWMGRISFRAMPMPAGTVQKRRR
jgi:hypothetical protein